MKLKKSMLFIMTLMVLIMGITAVGATSINDNNTVTTTSDSTSTLSSDASNTVDIAGDTGYTKTVKSEVKTNKKDVTADSTKSSIKTTKAAKKESSDVEKEVKTTQKSLKTDEEKKPIYVDNKTFDNYFTSTGLTDEISNGATIKFSSDVGRDDHSYVVDKPVTIDGN